MTANSFSAKKSTVLLAAGGTGGHLFPAQALAEVLIGRGYSVHLITDQRTRQYSDDFPAETVHVVPSASVTLSRPLGLPVQLLKLWSGYKKAGKIMRHFETEPAAIVGFGGYPSVPPMLAASQTQIPMILHEQNAVMGRANRALVSRCRAIASSFPVIANLSNAAARKVTFTGNPVRANVQEMVNQTYMPPDAGERFNLVVFGGSQGARYFSELMPKVVAELPDAIRRNLLIVQQCRPEDLEHVRQAYEQIGVEAMLDSFFFDMPEKIAKSHLVICRSGASSIAELAVIGRPSILVPLPGSINSDQQCNAESLHQVGGCWVFKQAELETGELAAFLTRLRYGPKELAHAADAARRFGKPDAAERLADLVENVIADHLTELASTLEGSEQ